MISVSVRFSERQTWQKEKSYSPILFYLSLQDFVLKWQKAQWLDYFLKLDSGPDSWICTTEANNGKGKMLVWLHFYSLIPGSQNPGLNYCNLH